MLTQEFIKEMQAKLVEEKQRLQEELGGLMAHTEIGDSLEDNAEEYEIDGVSQDIMAQLQEDLRKVERALEKVGEGTYGIDDEGKEISEERLRVLPWADKAL